MVFGADQSTLRLPRMRNPKVSADFLDHSIGQFPVSGNARGSKCLRMVINRVAGTFPEEAAPASFQMPDRLASFHAARISRASRITSLSRTKRRASSRLASMTNLTASFKFRRASGSVRPWVLAPGSSSTNPIHHLPSFSKTAVNLRFICRDYRRRVMKSTRIVGLLVGLLSACLAGFLLAWASPANAVQVDGPVAARETYSPGDAVEVSIKVVNDGAKK